jgi:hypothetical protein
MIVLVFNAWFGTIRSYTTANLSVEAQKLSFSGIEDVFRKQFLSGATWRRESEQIVGCTA